MEMYYSSNIFLFLNGPGIGYGQERIGVSRSNDGLALKNKTVGASSSSSHSERSSIEIMVTSEKIVMIHRYGRFFQWRMTEGNQPSSGPLF